MLDLLHFTPRARLQKARNPSSEPLSQFEDGWSTHTNDAPDIRGDLLYENDFQSCRNRHRMPLTHAQRARLRAEAVVWGDVWAHGT